MSISPDSFVVWYLVGRGRDGRWRDTLPVPTVAEAVAMAAEEERRGRPCVVAPLGAPAPAETDPAWWDFGALRRTAFKAGDDPDVPRLYAVPRFERAVFDSVRVEVGPGAAFQIWRANDGWFEGAVLGDTPQGVAKSRFTGTTFGRVYDLCAAAAGVPSQS